MGVTIFGLPQLLARYAAAAALGEIAGQAAVTALSEDVAGTAKSIVSVETGETYDSIEVTPEGVVAGGAALYLEFGTYKMAAQPFMRPAADGADDGGAIAAASAVFRAI
jgi:HK97 gp10 family phage protein